MTLSSPAAACEPQQEGAATVTSIDLGSDKAAPGSWVVIPMTLSVPEGVKIGTIKSGITFPIKLLSFEIARKGMSAESANAEIETLVKPDETNAENLILEVMVTSKEGKEIPAGLITKLVFKILESAPGMQTVNLRNVTSAFTADHPSKPVVPISGKDGEIKISGGVLSTFGCFFYMH